MLLAADLLAEPVHPLAALSPSPISPPSRPLPGENLYASSSASTCKAAVDAWMTEASSRGLHYTQIVYPATSQVGCAIASCGMVTCSCEWGCRGSGERRGAGAGIGSLVGGCRALQGCRPTRMHDLTPLPSLPLPLPLPLPADDVIQGSRGM